MIRKILFMVVMAVPVLCALETHELVNLRDYILPALWAHNSSTKKLYVRRHVAYALARVARLLHKRGLKLVIYDAYISPADIDRTEPECIRHARGTSVDVWLETIEGVLIDSPSEYNAFECQESHSGCEKISDAVRAHRDMFTALMKQCGFNPSEWWWHFDVQNWNDFDEIVYLSVPIA